MQQQWLIRLGTRPVKNIFEKKLTQLNLLLKIEKLLNLLLKNAMGICGLKLELELEIFIFHPKNVFTL